MTGAQLWKTRAAAGALLLALIGGTVLSIAPRRALHAPGLEYLDDVEKTLELQNRRDEPGHAPLAPGHLDPVPSALPTR